MRSSGIPSAARRSKGSLRKRSVREALRCFQVQGTGGCGGRIYRHFAKEAGRRTAEQFLESVNRTSQAQGLANAPKIGEPFEVDSPYLAGLRVMRLSGRFKAYLILYRPLPQEIDVLRVVHGSRDIPFLLLRDAGDDEADDPPAS